MDTLDDQLAKLRLINSYPLTPRVYAASPKNVFSDAATLSGTVPSEVSPKKIGPAVPPKPNKKGSQLPESDSVVKDAAINKTEKSAIPSLHRKQPSYLAQHIYSNNKVTLDNPAILDQQLEALEHHKKQLQKKGLLQNKTPLPKLSSSSFISSGDGGNLSRNSPPDSYVYSNAKPATQATRKVNEVSNVYSNITNKQQQPFNAGENIQTGNFVYSNLKYTNNDEDLPPPPPLVIASNIGIIESSEYTNQCSVIDDDIPPPPSPVSSSYSELRRATDIYPKLPSYPVSSSAYGTNNHAKNTVVTNQQNEGKIGSQSTEISGCLSNDRQQTYINMNYNNDYNAYGSPLSQRSFSQSYSDYYGYGSSSQGSSTYESIYEPINPRPPSQLSSRSNYMPYTSYVNSSQISEGEVAAPEGVGASANLNIVAPLDVGAAAGVVSGAGNSKLHNHKEAEVEALTDLLVHSMDVGNDVDSFGICVACNERVIGENSGCTAMDQVYHIACFTCCQCQINLQGKPFYALDGKPYCEVDYLNTLEKCSVCMKPILERILRATGKPYHPQCFTCVVCNNSLDGIPFTVDATNQNYCIADFHKKFAPRCCVCKLPIMPENGQEETVRVVALDRSFHFECYKCEDCGLLLSSEAEGRGCYPLDDHVLCKSCNAKRVQMLTSRMTTEL